MKSGIGTEFQNETRYIPGGKAASGRVWPDQPGLYKEAGNRRILNLPPVAEFIGTDFLTAVRRRQSTRQYQVQPVNLNQISSLLWMSAGMNRQEGNYKFRTVPSAGALYPIETYLIAHNVDGLSAGIYHYQVKTHQLCELRVGDFRKEVTHAALDQPMAGQAAAVVIWTAMVGRSFWKYSERAYRYIYLDAGHMAGQFALGLSAMGLAGCQIAAFFDKPANNLLGIDGLKETTIYMSTVGHPAA